LKIVRVLLGEIAVAFDACVALNCNRRILIVFEEVVSDPDLDHPAQPALTQRRTINRGEELVGAAVPKPERRDRKAVQAEQIAPTLVERMQRLSEPVRKVEVPGSLPDLLRRGNVYQTPIVRFLAFVETISALLHL